MNYHCRKVRVFNPFCASQVQAMLKDPALQEEVLRVVRDMQMTLHGLRTANPPHSTAKARVENGGLE